jgi:hypothetical protein
VSGTKLADLLEETATVDVQVGSATVNLTYRVLWDARISDEDWATFKDMAVRQYLSEFLARVVKQWDLIGEDDQPMPITAEAIQGSAIPNRLLQAFIDAITGSAVSGKARSNGLHAT